MAGGRRQEAGGRTGGRMGQNLEGQGVVVPSGGAKVIILHVSDDRDELVIHLHEPPMLEYNGNTSYIRHNIFCCHWSCSEYHTGLKKIVCTGELFQKTIQGRPC